METKEIIGAVGEAFIVICGVAVTQFFADGGAVVDTDPAFRTKASSKEPDRRTASYVICYMLALIVLVTLVLRFLIGSHVQLLQEYAKVDEHSFNRFVTDACFLMFFGAFLVAVAQSKSVAAFMGWLAVLSVAGVLWSLIARWRGDTGLPDWWLKVNLVQFGLSFWLSLWCTDLRAESGFGRMRAIWGLALVGAWSMIIFVFDLERIILNKFVFWGKSF